MVDPKALKRLGLVLTRLCDEDEVAADNAIRGFREICKNHNIDLRDLKLTQNDASERMIVDYEMDELRAVVAELEQKLELTAQQKHDLEERLRRITPPQLVPEKKTRKTRNEPVPNFPWTPEQLKIATDLFLTGRKNEEICSAVGCNPNQVLARFNNGPPTMPVEVKEEGPITWEEAWQIGHDLFRKGWMSKVINKLGIKKGACKPPQDINLQTNPAEIAALRALWRAEMATPKRRRRMPVAEP